MESSPLNFTPEQKVNIQREPFITRVPVSDGCDKRQI
jgi:hypothetical protein